MDQEILLGRFQYYYRRGNKAYFRCGKGVLKVDTEPEAFEYLKMHQYYDAKQIFSDGTKEFTIHFESNTGLE